MNKCNDNFIDVQFSIDNLDRYYIRTSIFKALNNALPLFEGKLLDIGCGKMPYKHYIMDNGNVKEYVGLDIDSAIEYDKYIKPDYVWDGEMMPFTDNYCDTVIATEVLEHCPTPSKILDEAYRVLKNNGKIFITIPFLWPLHETPHDEYRYTPFSMHRLFTQAGFKDIEIRAMGGWHASLAQMLGLWVKRSGLTNKKKKYCSIILKPIIKLLIKKDVIPTTFHEGLMITGLSIVAKK